MTREMGFKVASHDITSHEVMLPDSVRCKKCPHKNQTFIKDEPSDMTEFSS